MALDNIDENIVYILGIFCHYQRIFKKYGSNPKTIMNKFNQPNVLLKRL